MDSNWDKLHQRMCKRIWDQCKILLWMLRKIGNQSWISHSLWLTYHHQTILHCSGHNLVLFSDSVSSWLYHVLNSFPSIVCGTRDFSITITSFPDTESSYNQNCYNINLLQPIEGQERHKHGSKQVLSCHKQHRKVLLLQPLPGHHPF